MYPSSLSLLIDAAILGFIIFNFVRYGARRGFTVLLGVVILCAVRTVWLQLSIASMVEKAQSHPEQTAQASAATPEKSYLYRVESGAELQVRMAALRKREADLQMRKSELAPGDQPGTQALAREIAKYNDDLKPVLEALKDRPELAQ